MTKDTDKLIALSGLAREMYNSISHRAYLAGLWENDLIESLLWRVKDGKQGDGSHVARIGSYQAPTWSWASILGVVERGDNTNTLADGTEVLITILETSVTPTDKEDPWGAIGAAVMTVRGRIIPGKAILWETWKTDDDHGSGRSQFSADVNIGDFVPHSERGLGRRRVICNTDDRREFEHLRNPSSTRLLALLPIVRAERRTAAVNWTAEFEGLDIANTSVLGLYTQVGQFGAHVLDVVRKPLSDLQTAIEDLEEVEIRLV